MLKIAHTADIHIRALSRHDEYRHVFKAFIDDCRTQKVDHIFIGGDIFHTKTTGISPEYIDLLTWWLNEMTAVAPVHMVLGNHDGNLVNLSRQDAVSPIVDAMKNPRVFLYKKSGVYNFSSGYNFCVFSCFDEEGWKDVSPVPGDVNIATFHAPVRGSVTETGWDIDDEDITTEFFKDYDFCLLGDIHKQQFLGYRDGKPWIGYPGTPIQQNYAEQLDHGYLLWNIENSSNWTVTNRPLPNPKPFITLDWAGSLEKTLKLAKACPQGTRFRVRSTVQLTQDDIHILSETLKTSLNATEVTYKSDVQIDTGIVKANSTSVAKTDLRSPEVIGKLIRDYYDDLNLTDKDLESLTETAKFYLNEVGSSEDFARNSKWSLRRLEWSNMFAYGEDNVVNFDKLNGIVGIFGPNRTGKSSIVGTLMYTLFNATDRGPIKNINICNVRKDYCSGRAVLDHNGSTYVIERQTTKTTNKKGVVNASTSLNLFRMRDDGEDMDDLCGEQRTDTEKSLRTLLGHPDDFLITSLSAQGETNQFLSQGSSKRRSVLTKFLDLDVFDKMHDLSSKEVSSVKSQLKNFPDRNWEELRTQYESSATLNKENIQILSDLILENQTSLSLLKSDLSKHNASPVTNDDVEAQERRVKDLERKSSECANSITSLEDEIEKLQVKSDALQKLIDSIDVDDLKNKQETQRKLQSVISELRHVHEKEDALLLQQKKSLKILDEVPCGDEHPTCKFIKDAHVNKKSLPEQTKKVDKALKILDEAKFSLDKVHDDSISEKISKYEKASELLTKMNLEISKKETEIAKLKSSCDTCASSLAEANVKLVNLRESLKNDENEEVVTIRSKITELSRLIREYDVQKLDSASQLGKLQSAIEKLSEEKATRDGLLQNVRMHELVSNAFSKKGIPLLVTKSQLPLINSEVSKILQGIVDFTIEVESDEDTDSLEIYINYGDSKRIIELCSGMEKTISAIALRVAMINVSSLSKPDFFIIDEGFGTLDNAGVEACARLLTSLKRHFKTVIVITHVDGIKDSADHILEITKNEKDSRMEYN
jgi:DNA repair exonuclease SbcCD ATPase subunit/DNA repair exonuclease SbcCD nuclease subunit